MPGVYCRGTEAVLPFGPYVPLKWESTWTVMTAHVTLVQSQEYWLFQQQTVVTSERQTLSAEALSNAWLKMLMQPYCLTISSLQL